MHAYIGRKHFFIRTTETCPRVHCTFHNVQEVTHPDFTPEIKNSLPGGGKNVRNIRNISAEARWGGLPSTSRTRRKEKTARGKKLSSTEVCPKRKLQAWETRSSPLLRSPAMEVFKLTHPLFKSLSILQ